MCYESGLVNDDFAKYWKCLVYNVFSVVQTGYKCIDAEFISK